MVCNCDISIGYVVDNRLVTTVPPFYIPPAGIINGKSYYVWTDIVTDLNFTISWNPGTNQWEVYEDSEGILYAYLPYTGDCPGDPEEEENIWFINEEFSSIISFKSFLDNCIVDPQCVAWENGTLESLPFPWNDYTFILNDFPNPETLYPGQLISELYFSNPLAIGGTGEYKIGTLVYLLGTTVYNSYVVGSEFIGVLIIDSEGTIIIPSDEVLNTGYVCLTEKENTSVEDNFNTCVLDKQCEFAKCVLKYLQMLQFGAINTGACKELETLKNKKRVLEILNCYDSRDIEENTLNYNSISYNKIKQLLNS